ncbi:helix-turn-helix transcriptional regulator [Paractinoplanes deccanensis]|uniref:Helix-turn-helix transcriptional regulator n=1 Tax=Paractinoplanes deccanensis TaxID=113561 RepID=A0ABQ3Y876_9ACTN|nr:helix-turn-helix transcriptional regulator [Actinoplanes deccanensis]GID76065.1 helix-turn-helix transcriptional regulator [Actinoplanes deccanensis]
MSIVGVATPFVGRGPELACLAEMLARAAERSPKAVVLVGDAGVGKTRLLREFAAAARTSGARVISGSCVALGSGELPYAPLIDALRRLARDVGDDTLRELAGPAYADLAGLIADFHDSGRPADPRPASQLVVFGAVLRLLDRLSTDEPVVLVFEDLHWADQSTLDLLAYLTRGLTDERVLLVGSYRASDLPDRHALRAVIAELDFARRLVHLELTGFAPDELRRFLGHLTGTRTDDELFARAFELSEGNAFFAEELVVAGVLLSPAPGATVRLPRTLRDLILARFERLGDASREVMRVAATAGRRVSHRLLATVCGLPTTALHAALRECVSQHMLVTDPEDDTYVFRHALLREAVHQDLLPGERIGLHAAIAAAIIADEQLGLPEDVTLAAELSYHWYEAREYGHALAAAIRAGDTAVRVRAFREAELQYLRALELWPRVAEPAKVAGVPRDRVLGAAAEAARWAGHVDRAVELAREALDDLDATTSPARAGELLERLGRYLWESADTVGSREAYVSAGGLLAGQEPSALAARVIAGQALAEVQAGRYTAGLRAGREAVAMARTVQAREEEGRALNTVGVALTMLGRVDEGVGALRVALTIAEDTDNLEDLFRAYGNLMVSLENSGRLEESVRVALDGVDRARRSGLEHTRPGGVLANNASAVLTQLGRWDEAIALIADLVADRPVRQSLYPRLTLAEIDVARGRFDQARERLTAIREAAANLRDPQFLGALVACESELAIWSGEPDEARKILAAGLDAIGDTEHVVVRLRLYALALRVEADEWLRLALRHGHDPEDVRVEELHAAAARSAPAEAHDPKPEERALRLLCRAERERASRADPALWAETADAWLAFGRVPPAAYARWREAEAAVEGRDRQRATRAAREAHRAASRLGAEPLLREVSGLARRARLDLREDEAAREPGPGRADRPFGLTPREREVLRRLGDGQTNRQIARALFITEKTASVHVSNILMKLGVGNRGEAAAAAHRLGLFDDR